MPVTARTSPSRPHDRGTGSGAPAGPTPATPDDGTGPKPPDGRLAGRIVAHAVGYAHLDPVWLWRWQEGYAEARATLRSAVDRLGEYPEAVFATTSVQFLEWVAEVDPGLLDAVAERVRDGRLHVAGGWWVEADCNIPSGESLVRQGLHAQRWLADRFGVIATVGANPDSFGHPGTLPQLLAGCGLDGYVLTRPSREELHLPAHAFRWRAPDGTSVVAYRTRGYCTDRGDVAEHLRSCVADAGGDPSLLLFYGVGNHGGGPTRANLDSLRRVAATSASVEVVCSSPAAYLSSLDAEALPVVEAELQHHARGCYSAHAGIKRWNRRAESELLSAERWASVAAATTGLAYPAAELTGAWRRVLLNQFHDTLAGTAIASAYDDARNDLGEALAVAGRVVNAACARLALRADIPADADAQPILVFNPHAWPLRAVVEHEVGGWARRTNLRDDADRPVALQWGESEATLVEGRYRAVFPVEVPPLGFRVYRLVLGPCEVDAPPVAADGVLDNGIVAARIDPSTGGLASLRVRGGPELARPGAHAVAVIDESDTWGHGVRAFDGEADPFQVTSVRTVEHGPARTVVRAVSRWGRSTLVEDWSLGTGDAYVDVDVTLDWRERGRLCKLRFPTAVRSRTVTAEVAYGVARRDATGDEEPMHRWVDASGTTPTGEPGGVAVANDGKHGYDADDDGDGVDLGITVARATVHAWHDPAVLDPAARYDWMDQGVQRFRLRVVGHAGDLVAAEVGRRAAELNQPPHVRRDTSHPGDLGGSGTFASVDGEGASHVELTVLKRAEDATGTILRLAETAGRAADVVARAAFLGREVPVALRAWEVATVLLPDDPDRPPSRVDLCEWAPGARPPGQPLPTAVPALPPRTAVPS